MHERARIPQRWHLYVVSFSHVTSFFTILPMLPFLNEKMGVTGALYALSFSGYYIFQLLSGCEFPSSRLDLLYFGRVRDRLGKRNVLLLSLLGIAICWNCSRS